MFVNQDDQINFVKNNFPEITGGFVSEKFYDDFCQICQITCRFDVVNRALSYERMGYAGVVDLDYFAARTKYLKCPVCSSYKVLIYFEVEDDDGNEHYYCISNIPTLGGVDIPELPDEPPSLKSAYYEAMKCWNAGAHIAAAAMFRRALQAITRGIFGITPSTLGGELKQLKGKKYNGVSLTNDFHDKTFILREAGNQGAHPDADPDLLDFTSEDVEDLYSIFMEVVMELFVLPKAVEKRREDFLKRRKIPMQKNSRVTEINNSQPSSIQH